MRSLLLIAVFSASAAPLCAQSLGTVSVEDATLNRSDQGLLPVAKGRLTLSGSATVRAKDGRNAPVELSRGGSILVCRTSPLHLAGTPEALAIGLDRGAMEIRTRATASDAILTPDMRITAPAGGPLDLRLRVSPNGDTCVENRGRKAPVLLLSDAFGAAHYQLRPGQHVMFEHGSLRAVVDRETTPCGCPPEDPRPVPLAEALLHGNGVTVTPAQAAAANPFPAAQSEGLAAPAPLPADQPGVTHTQVATTFSYDPAAPKTAPASDEPPAIPAPPPAAETKGGPLRAVGRFFKRIFVR